jgi:Gram-negative porin
MIRGFMKTTSRTALLAAAGILMGSYAYGPAKAADLGGSCCGDLEERVAELEATTARKGNRVVSLQIYGQVNKGLLIWDDGINSDAFVVDNDYSGSRFGLTGKATMKPGWTAGYLIELDIQDAASDKVNNGARTTGTGFKNGDDPADEIGIRYNNVYIESDRLGRVTIGQGSTAADGANEVVLGNSMRNSDIQHGNSFALRFSDHSFADFTLGNIAANLDTSRDDVIRYDSPSIYGFILSASWGDNDYADVALRFKSEWNSIRVAAALAYVWDGTSDGSATTNTGSLQEAVSSFKQVGGSVSIQHIPTGIYGAFAAATRDYEDPVGTSPGGFALSDSARFWYFQGGVERKWTPYGSTTIYGEYGRYSDIAFNGSDTTRWGLGVVQKVDSAALELYAQAAFWSFDGFSAIALANPEDLTTVMIGSRIKF